MTTQEFRDSINITSGEDAMRFDQYEPSWNHTPETFRARMRARIAKMKADKESVTDAALVAGHAAMQLPAPPPVAPVIPFPFPDTPIAPSEPAIWCPAAEPCTDLCEDPHSHYMVTS